MYDQDTWKKIVEALWHAERNAHKNNKQGWAALKATVSLNIDAFCEDCGQKIRYRSALSTHCEKCAVDPWIEFGKKVDEWKTKLGYTAESYADYIINDKFSPYTPQEKLDLVAKGLADWIDEDNQRTHYAVVFGVNEDYVAEKQAEAVVKRQAYQLALKQLATEL